VAINRPDRPVRIILPDKAGGITDMISRGVAAGLQAALGQPMVVGNRPGANGTVGTLAAARREAGALSHACWGVGSLVAPRLRVRGAESELREAAPALRR
jgi:tripartite-type tricarboxylate transporter receptor subunit TctC